MTQALNYLLPEHENLSSDFQHPWKSSVLGVVMCTYTLSTGVAAYGEVMYDEKGRKILGTY